jgi:hypothetical protein
MSPTNKSSNVRTGLALALSFFAISVFLYFQPTYLGSVTRFIAIAFVVIGICGLGLELEKLYHGKDDPTQNAGIFDNLGIGLGLLIIWIILYVNFAAVWLNILIGLILIFAT